MGVYLKMIIHFILKFVLQYNFNIYDLINYSNFKYINIPSSFCMLYT